MDCYLKWSLSMTWLTLSQQITILKMLIMKKCVLNTFIFIFPDSWWGPTYLVLHPPDSVFGSRLQGDRRAVRPLHHGHGVLQGTHRAHPPWDNLLRGRVSRFCNPVHKWVLIIWNQGIAFFVLSVLSLCLCPVLKFWNNNSVKHKKVNPIFKF